MEQQSNNNLDELFQKAAEEYPLKINNKNWDVVAAKLHSTLTASPGKKNNKWLYAGLLVLVLGGGFFIIDSLNKKPAESSLKIQTTSSEKNINSNKPAAKTSANATSDMRNNVAQEQLNPNQKTFSNSNHKISYSENNLSTKNINIDLSNQESNISANQNQLPQQPKLTANNNYNQSVNGVIPQKEKQNTISNNAVTSSYNNAGKNNKTELATNEKSERINLKPQPKTFYGEFFFSPDFSTIKFQHINKPGYLIGVALGYRFSNRISAEIGLQRIHANFYSVGKYFDTSNLKIKGKPTLDDLNGNNKITEVPVAIRYNLLKNNDHLFATAGTTVALITHTEKYDYNVIRNGEQRDVYRKFSALTGTKFFSSINFSVGYQTPVANLFDLKIEPYYQAATKGLGVGNLPVTNFGVNIGIIKDLK